MGIGTMMLYRPHDGKLQGTVRSSTKTMSFSLCGNCMPPHRGTSQNSIISHRTAKQTCTEHPDKHERAPPETVEQRTASWLPTPPSVQNTDQLTLFKMCRDSDHLDLKAFFPAGCMPTALLQLGWTIYVHEMVQHRALVEAVGWLADGAPALA